LRPLRILMQNQTFAPMLRTKRLIIFIVILFAGCAVDGKKIEPQVNDGTYISIRGNRIYYEERGSGTPLLLLSGGGLSRSVNDFSSVIPELTKHFRVIAPDTPGQGKSEQIDSISYEIITETMSELIDSLNLDSVYVMGWSDGGVVGIMLAERKSDKVKKVIAVGPNNGKKGFAIPAGFPLDSVVAPSLEIFERMNPELVEDYSRTPGRDWKKQVSGLNAMWYANEYFPSSVYDRIQIPVMIVLGDRDDISVEHGLEMHRAIGKSQLCVLPNTTHEVFKERPALITSIAVDFLNSSNGE
jgi:pimeloyl-ACP methyl ester carboxylesterase